MAAKLVVATITWAFASFAMADENYVKLDGIAGDSQDEAHKDWIVI